jgi:hypothetical protein
MPVLSLVQPTVIQPTVSASVFYSTQGGIDNCDRIKGDGSLALIGHEKDQCLTEPCHVFLHPPSPVWASRLVQQTSPLAIPG